MARKKVEVVSLKMVKEKTLFYESRQINSPYDAYVILSDFLSDADREKVMVICVNVKNEPVNITTVSIGTINQSFASTREILKTAIISNSPKIILAHNHPSGDTTPSQADWKTTEQLVKACKLLDIELLDHIIIGGESYLSLKMQNPKTFTL